MLISVCVVLAIGNPHVIRNGIFHLESDSYGDNFDNHDVIDLADSHKLLVQHNVLNTILYRISSSIRILYSKCLWLAFGVVNFVCLGFILCLLAEHAFEDSFWRKLPQRAIISKSNSIYNYVHVAVALRAY